MTRTDVKIHSRRPRIVMLLANSFLHDTRVYKEARSLIEWGCEVHVIAMCNSALPTKEEVDGIHVHRVSMRRGDLWRLFPVVLCWCCRPALRWLLRPVRVRALPHETSEVTGESPAPLARLRSALNQLYRRHLARVRLLRAASPRVAAVVRFLRRVVAYFYRGAVRFGYRPIVRAVRAEQRRFRMVVRGISRRCQRLVPTSGRLLAINVGFVRKTLELAPDIVQSHDLNTLFGGALVKRLTGARLVYDSHELFLKRNIGNKSRARDNLIWAPIERFCIGKCDAVLSVAEGICDYLAKQYGISKPHLIRNVQPFEPPGARTTILADELGIPAGRRIVIYPGAITINRGLEVMIDSAPYLNGAAYVIMGYARNADYLASLKQRATKLGVMSSSVFFREAVPIDDVVRYVASADLGIVPTQNVCLSYFFESSNKIFHCVMAGVPVAMSDHLEKRLLVEEYGIGVLFDETDPTKIARVVNETLDDREAYAVMRRNCLEAARVLNWEHEEHNFRQIFADLLGDRAAPIPQVLIESVCAIQTQSPGHPHYVTTK